MNYGRDRQIPLLHIMRTYARVLSCVGVCLYLNDLTAGICAISPVSSRSNQHDYSPALSERM